MSGSPAPQRPPRPKSTSAGGAGAAGGGAQPAEGAEGGGGGGGGGVKRKAGIFTKELRSMMYGFGDDPEPLQESVELMEDIVIDYLTDIVHTAQELPGSKGKVAVEDVLFLVRKDPRKFARAKELLAMNERIKSDRAMKFQDNELEGGKDLESMLGGI